MRQGGGDGTLHLAGGTVARFVGDVHLGDGGRSDIFRGKDELLVRSLRESANACDAVVFMGDALDLPQGFTLRRIAAAHPTVFAEIDALARRVRVIFVRGNHDWRVDYPRLFPAASACERLVIGGDGGILAWHGHQLDRSCDPRAPLYVIRPLLFSLAERAFRFDFRVPLADHDSWQNRVGHWLGHGYARFLRRVAAAARQCGHRGPPIGEEFIAYWSKAVWGEGPLLDSAAALLGEGRYGAMVCGHTHVPGVVDLGGSRFVNAGSWAFGAAGVARLDDDGRFAVEDARTGEAIGDERYRTAVNGDAPGDFFAWWARHYRGRLRFDWEGAGDIAHAGESRR